MLTVHELVAGRSYRILRDFDDYYGQRFRAGEVLTFSERHFLPYHDGHTLVFAERRMYLEGGSELYDRFCSYVGEAPPSDPGRP